MTRRDILLHVANHGTYHRGNVAAMMYQAGGAADHRLAGVS